MYNHRKTHLKVVIPRTFCRVKIWFSGPPKSVLGLRPTRLRTLDDFFQTPNVKFYVGSTCGQQMLTKGKKNKKVHFLVLKNVLFCFFYL